MRSYALRTQRLRAVSYCCPRPWVFLARGTNPTPSPGRGFPAPRTRGDAPRTPPSFAREPHVPNQCPTCSAFMKLTDTECASCARGRCPECEITPLRADNGPCRGCARELCRCLECGGWRVADQTCRSCAYKETVRSPIPPELRCKGCGKARPEHATRCSDCAGRRLIPERARRERQRQAALPASVRSALLERLVAGERLSVVAEELGISHQRVWKAADAWPEWAEALDAALMEGRPGGVVHGTSPGYKRCQCPECREAKRRYR